MLAGLCGAASGLSYWQSTRLQHNADVVRAADKKSLKAINVDLTTGQCTSVYAVVEGTSSCDDLITSPINGFPCIHFKTTRTYCNWLTTHEADSAPLLLKDGGLSARVLFANSKDTPTQRVPHTVKQILLAMVGYRINERILRANRDMFVLGHWEGKNDRIRCGQTYSKDEPFICRLGTAEQFVQHQEFWATNLKVCSGLLGFIGIGCIHSAKDS